MTCSTCTLNISVGGLGTQVFIQHEVSYPNNVILCKVFEREQIFLF